jgi:hypothetical protein
MAWRFRECVNGVDRCSILGVCSVSELSMMDAGRQIDEKEGDAIYTAGQLRDMTMLKSRNAMF